jgi:GTPase SAR1 family protein
MILFDVSQRQSFDDMRCWVDFAKEGCKDVQILIFGNKVDLVDERMVSFDEAESWAQENNLEYMEGSAKTGQGVKDLVEQIADRVWKAQEAKPPIPEISLKMTPKSKECC